MQHKSKKKIPKIMVMGGDERNLHLINYLVDKGLQVYAVGFDRVGYQVKGELLNSFADENLQYDVIILPITGVDKNGNIPTTYSRKKLNFYDETRDAGKIPLVLIGKADGQLQEFISAKQGLIIETTNLDELAIYNSIPTAEGAVLKASELSKFTIHGSNALILGFGRCGLTIARLLINMGAEVTVAARRTTQLARAKEMTAKTLHIGKISQSVKEFQLIFNTVPELILTESVVKQLPSDAVIIDIASGGGTDFKACRNYNINAVLEPGIPGKVAPKTAGYILGEVYSKLLYTYLGEVKL